MTESAFSPQDEDVDIEEEFEEADDRGGAMPPQAMNREFSNEEAERGNGDRDERSSSGRSSRSDSSGGRTYRQLYAEAQRRNLDGRSKMSKAQLERALS